MEKPTDTCPECGSTQYHIWKYPCDDGPNEWHDQASPDDISEYQALLKEYGEEDLTERDKEFIQWTMQQLGVRADAAAGTAKHHLEAYDKMMKVALPVFKFEADRDNGPYAHIPYCTFKHIDETDPDK
jgi:hypothetical protein